MKMTAAAGTKSAWCQTSWENGAFWAFNVAWVVAVASAPLWWEWADCPVMLRDPPPHVFNNTPNVLFDWMEYGYWNVHHVQVQTALCDIWWWCVPIGVGYMFLIFAIQECMKSHDRFELRGPLILWNVLLASFSVSVTLRLLPEFYDILTNAEYGSLVASACDERHKFGDTAIWRRLFLLSKVVEMGDTFFVVLRKQPLIFLHWYHHLVTMIYCWMANISQPATGRWFLMMNSIIHSVMYTYYALKAMKIRVPRLISMCLTTMQLSQMFVGTFIVSMALHVKRAGHFCDTTFTNVYFALAMYLSYVGLFARYFYKAYLAPRPIAAKLRKPDMHSTNGIVSNGVSNGLKKYE